MKRPTDSHRLPPEEGWTPATSDTDFEEMLRRRVPVRVRVAQALALVAVMAVVAGLVVHSLPVAPGRSQAGMATPTPVPLGPILLVSNVSYGTVTLNGAPLAGSPPLVATFRRGLNSITLTAPPFRPRTCHVRWPGRQSDGDCDLPQIGAQPQSVGGRPVSPVLVVELPFGLGDLPDAAQALAAATDALQSAPPRPAYQRGSTSPPGRTPAEPSSTSAPTCRWKLSCWPRQPASATVATPSAAIRAAHPVCPSVTPQGSQSGWWRRT